MDFKCLKQGKDENGSPIFGFQVMIEGVEGGSGQGYSKKEAQQLASKETLQRLRREPQFIDAIFAAKSNRTKMEEEPTTVAPDVDALTRQEVLPDTPADGDDNTRQEVPTADDNTDSRRTPKPQPEADDTTDDFDLSDITHNPKETSREDIIAAAEAEAYKD